MRENLLMSLAISFFSISSVIYAVLILSFSYSLIRRVIRGKKQIAPAVRQAEEIVQKSKLSKLFHLRAVSWKSRLFLFATGLYVISIGLLVIISPSVTEKQDAVISESEIYYVKPEAANVRECPRISCKVIDALPRNTELVFPGDLFDKYPDWAEITFESGEVGYVSKSTLSSEMSPETSIETPRRESDGGILLGEGNFSPLEIGYSYDISFCLPDSARSGATCGGLTGDTQNPVGGSPPYSFVKGGGFFPPGMSLELNGLMTGAPTTAGTYNFKICAKDLQMNQGCQDYTLVVIDSSPRVSTEDESQNGQLPLENNNASLTITSGRCGEKFEDTEHITGDMWAGVFFEGDVSGPIGASLDLNRPGWDKINCGEWSLSGTLCVRENVSQSQATHWSVSHGDWISTRYFDVSGFVSGLVNGNWVHLAEAEQRINCVR